MSATKVEEPWQAGRSLLDCHKYMLDNEVATDLKLVFPAADGQRTRVTICAHRFVLICRSPVFEAMLTNDSYVETNNEVNIIDISPTVFKELLRYIYYEEIELSGDNILQVLYAAKKYFMDGAIKRCHDFLREEMTADNVCEIINNAVLFNERNLVLICLGYIALHVHEIFESKYFNKLNQSALHQILCCTGIGYELECDLFAHCMQWARYQQLTDKDSSLRQVLGNCVREIRFSKMTAKELAHVIANEPDILTFEEQANYFRHIADPQAGIVKNINQTSRDLRQFRVNRFPFTRNGGEQSLKNDTNEDVISFGVDKVIKVM